MIIICFTLYNNAKVKTQQGNIYKLLKLLYFLYFSTSLKNKKTVYYIYICVKFSHLIVLSTHTLFPQMSAKYTIHFSLIFKKLFGKGFGYKLIVFYNYRYYT